MGRRARAFATVEGDRQIAIRRYDAVLDELRVGAMIVKVAFWVSLGALAWTHAGYPVAAAAAARIRRRPVRTDDSVPSVSVIVAAYDEETVIERRLENLLSLDYPADRLEIVVASDASDDRTDELVEAVAAREPRVRLLRCPRGGKVAAQDRAVRETAGELVAFSDANALWAPDALARLVRSFADPEVAYVCGRLALTDAEGSNREGVYWRFETWLREQESALGSITGGNGAIYAVRRSDYVEVDPRFGHDLSLPYLMVQRGRRAVYDPTAVAFEKPTPELETEYRRKVRMFEHCWLIVLRGKMLRRLPPRYLVEILSHRHLRYGSGLLHVVLLGTNIALVAERAGTRLRRRPRRPGRVRRARARPGRPAALLRARHVGDRRRALELPAAWGARDLGRGRGNAVNQAIDEHVRRSIVKTHGNLYRRARLTRYPIPTFPLGPGEGRSLLDLGSNWGRWTIAASRAGYRATGIDPSRKAVAAARRVAEQLGVEAEYVVGDARELPFPDSAFDVVFSYSVLQHLPKDDVRVVAGEIERVLRPRRDGLDRDAERARAAESGDGARGAASPRGRARTSATGRSPSSVRRSVRSARSSCSPTAFLTINPQVTDLDLLPAGSRLVVRLSEALRRASLKAPFLVRVADSVVVRVAAR